MNRFDRVRPQSESNANSFSKVQAQSLRHEPNHPVPVDEFGREGMGVAAKE